MRAEYEDEPGMWMEDNVQTGIGKYGTKEEALLKEAIPWAVYEEECPYMNAEGKLVTKSMSEYGKELKGYATK
jgi:hypothetical protein